MLFILLSWLLQAAGLCGLGWLLATQLFRLHGAADWSAPHLFRAFWIGFGGLVAVAQLYALALPLRGAFLLLAGACAVPGLWQLGCAFRDRAPAARRAPDWRQVAFWTLLGLCLVRTAVYVSTPVWSGAYDSDLYHFGAVRWAKEYPTVPGLANLFGPLGISSTYLLYAAIVDHGIWYQRAAWILPGLFVGVFAAQLLWTLLCSRTAARSTRLFCGLALAYVVLLSGDSFASLYYDRAAGLCLLLAALEWLQLPRTAPASPERLAGVMMMLLLAAISVSIKPVGLVAAGLLGGAGLFQLRGQPPRAAAGRVLLLPLLLAAGMLARNAVLSGWLGYPAPVGRLPVSWALPETPPPGANVAQVPSVRGGYALFQAWARQPGPDYVHALHGGRWQWLPGWWSRHRQAGEVKLFGGGLLLVALGLGLALRRRRPPEAPLLLALAVTATNLLFWFVTAPDLRFGEGLFWLWFALAGACGLAGLTDRRATLAGAGLLLAAVLVTPVNWSLPAPITAWRIGHAGAAPQHRVQLANGQQPPLTVLVPDGDDRSGDAPLPSTPYPNPALCCRVPGELRHGFYLAPPPARR